MPTRGTMAGAALVVAIAAPALAQSLGLQPVAAGTDDASPMSNSLELMPIDLRDPAGFDRVYRLPTEDGSLFARADGGLTAIFPRSEYTATPWGTVAEVPAGTVWVIGQTPRWLADRSGLLTTDTQTAWGVAVGANAQRVDLRAHVATPGDPVPVPAPMPIVELPAREDLAGALDASAPDAGEPAALDLEDPGATPWGSDGDRGRRMMLLLTHGARAEEASDDSDAG
ncbi:MAG: hypothetical protein R3B49_03485 [Phycisphaerales bacterium]